MKVKVSQETINKILSSPEECLKAGIKVKDPWWVILLKVVAYAIGLILGGAVTTSCVAMANVL